MSAACGFDAGEAFSTLIADLKANIGEWRQWYDMDAPESHPMPQGYSDKLSPLEKMLVLRCFRVDRIVPAIIKFVMTTMGSEYVTPPVLDFMSIYKDSRPLVPVIFVLSPGADPATDIFKLANKLGSSWPRSDPSLPAGLAGHRTRLAPMAVDSPRVAGQ